MSLDFVVTDMKNYEVLTTLESEYGSRWHYVTDALVWSTMAIGMRTITEKNWKDFYNRLNMYEKVNGSFLTSRRGDRPITAMEVYAHIGLSTNASEFSKTEFNKKLWKRHEADNKGPLDKVPNRYEELELDSISKEEFQELNQQDFINWDEAFLARKNKKESVD